MKLDNNKCIISTNKICRIVAHILPDCSLPKRDSVPWYGHCIPFVVALAAEYENLLTWPLRPPFPIFGFAYFVFCNFTFGMISGRFGSLCSKSDHSTILETAFTVSRNFLEVVERESAVTGRLGTDYVLVDKLPVNILL